MRMITPKVLSVAFSVLAATAGHAQACLNEQDVPQRFKGIKESWLFLKHEDITSFLIAYANKGDIGALLSEGVDHVLAFEQEGDKATGVFISHQGCAIGSVGVSDKQFRAHWDHYLNHEKAEVKSAPNPVDMRPA